MQEGSRTRLLERCVTLFILAAFALPATHAADAVRVGVYANAPKLMPGPEGQPSGILGDLLQAMAEQEQWQLVPVQCQWEECLGLLAEGRIDLLPDVALTAERKARFAFHQHPALHSWSQMFGAADTVYTSPMQLSGLRIAILSDSVQQDFLQQLASGFGLDIRIQPVDSFDAAFRQVRSGAADLAVSNHLYGNFHAARYGLQPTAIIFQPSRLFYAAPQGSGVAMLSRIDYWLERWTGEPGSPYYTIMQRWGAYSPPTERSSFLLWGAVLLGLMLLVAIAVAFRLTRQVRHRSAALAESRFRLSETLNFDSVTGLPNRHQLMQRLRKSLVAARHAGRDGAVLHIDLDNFRDLNDLHGHETGDRLLAAVAERLNDLPIHHFTPARFDGDAFILLIESFTGGRDQAQSQVEQAAHAVREALGKPFALQETIYNGSACIGVVMFSDVDYDPHDLLKSAELAMYDAKTLGRGSLRFFNPQMQEQARQRADLDRAIYQALDHREFALWYQPQYDADHNILGLEALVRWEKPGSGVIRPDVFIPAAETSGLIRRLGTHILHDACARLASWAGQPTLGNLSIAVNISARQLHDESFVDEVCGILDETGADGNLLELELTESVLVTNVEEAIVKMERLRARGVRFSLDDFGTGYSSMNYLKRLPLEKLKIDKSFVRDLLDDPNDAAIVRTIVALGQSLGLSVIAEGVETVAQRDMLLESGCSSFQGYLFSYPVPVTEIEERLGQHP